MSDYEKKLSKKPERFAMNMPDLDISRVEKIARENGCTMSWIYRALLFAVAKKFKHGFPEDIEVHRPDKFQVPYRQTVVCFYGDKSKWMSLSRIWNVELGPLVRFALELYYKGELELDLKSPKTIKESKLINHGKKSKQKSQSAKNRYIHLYQNEAIQYRKKEYRPKNSDRNIFLMEWGLANRIHPLILS